MVEEYENPLRKTLKDIKIPHYKKYFIKLMDNFNVSREYKHNNIVGGKTTKLEYKGFVFYCKQKKDNSYDISIRRNDNEIERNIDHCLHIIIDKHIKDYNKDKLAYIENISYYNDCIKTGLKHPGGGSVLLKLALKFLKKNKDKFDINRIYLVDNSNFYCKGLSKNINLPILSTLIYGHTWYGKYGFRPYDSANNKPNEILLKKYNNNKKIIKTEIIKYTTLPIHLLKMIETNETDKEKIKKTFKTFYNEYSKLHVYEYFEIFINTFDSNCKLLSTFYEEFADDIGLYDFHGKSFYLDI